MLKRFKIVVFLTINLELAEAKLLKEFTKISLYYQLYNMDGQKH